jgi:hypothetical protein
MKIESQDPKVFRKIRAISELKDGERFFKMFGALWFLETLRYSTDNSTRITTFECELIGVIKTKQPKRKSNV